MLHDKNDLWYWTNCVTVDMKRQGDKTDVPVVVFVTFQLEITPRNDYLSLNLGNKSMIIEKNEITVFEELVIP